MRMILLWQHVLWICPENAHSAPSMSRPSSNSAPELQCADLVRGSGTAADPAQEPRDYFDPARFPGGAVRLPAVSRPAPKPYGTRSTRVGTPGCWCPGLPTTCRYDLC